MNNKRQYIYLVNRMVCIFRDIRVLRDQSGTEKEVEDLEKQHEFVLKESLIVGNRLFTDGLQRVKMEQLSI